MMVTDNPEYIIRMAMVGFHPGTVIYDEALAEGFIPDKVAYLESGKFEFNGSKLDDATHGELKNRLIFLNEVAALREVVDMDTDQDGKISATEPREKEEMHQVLNL